LLVRGVFVFSELAPAHPPLAHSIHASGLVKYFRLRDGIDPRTPAPGLYGYPSGWVRLCASHIRNGSRGFLFLVANLFGAYLERDEKAQGVVVKGVWSILHKTGKGGRGIDWKMARDESD
jgi:hypothetical protein